MGSARQSETLQAESRPRLSSSPTESEPPIVIIVPAAVQRNGKRARRSATRRTDTGKVSAICVRTHPFHCMHTGLKYQPETLAPFCLNNHFQCAKSVKYLPEMLAPFWIKDRIREHKYLSEKLAHFLTNT